MPNDANDLLLAFNLIIQIQDITVRLIEILDIKKKNTP